MALIYVLDENLRGPLWMLIIHHNRKGVDPIDVVRVGDPNALALGAKDPDLLRWAEHAGRIVVSGDKRTIPGHLAAHFAAGRRSPGVMIPVPGAPLRTIAEFARDMAAEAAKPAFNFRTAT